MRPKTVAILLLIFILVTLSMAFLIRHKSVGVGKKSVGIRIFSDIPVDKIHEIDIKGEDFTVSLIKKNGIWTVKEHFGYLADFSQISDLVEELKSASTGQHFKAHKKLLKKLMLMNPDDPEAKEDEKGRLLIFKDKEGKCIKGIIFGKAMRQSGEEGFPVGQYVRFLNSNDVYLIGQYFTCLTQGPREWIKLDILDIKPKDIKQVKGYEGKVVYVIARNKKDNKLFLKEGPSKKMDTKLIKKISRGLDYLRIEDVADPKSSFAKISKDSYVEYELFNGIIYRVYPGKCSKDSCYMKISVAYNGSDKKLSQKAKKLNNMLSPWTFKISKWRYESFFLP